MELKSPFYVFSRNEWAARLEGWVHGDEARIRTEREALSAGGKGATEEGRVISMLGLMHRKGDAVY